MPKPSGKIVLVERLGAEGDVGAQFFVKLLHVSRSGRVRLASRDPDVSEISGDLVPDADLRVVALFVTVLGQGR